jgi:hypothetical protein
VGATIYGQVELSLCTIDRRGLLPGLARAAAARGVWFNWSAKPPDEAEVAAFWARVGAPRAPASRCLHQEVAGLHIERGAVKLINDDHDDGEYPS